MKLWTPPIQVSTSTGPAPGTGYDDDGSWWRDPLEGLLEGATEKIRDELHLDRPIDSSSPIDAPPQRAGVAGTGMSMTNLLLWGGFIFGAAQLALNYAAVKKPRRSRR